MQCMRTRASPIASMSAIFRATPKLKHKTRVAWAPDGKCRAVVPEVDPDTSQKQAIHYREELFGACGRAAVHKMYGVV